MKNFKDWVQEQYHEDASFFDLQGMAKALGDIAKNQAAKANAPKPPAKLDPKNQLAIDKHVRDPRQKKVLQNLVMGAQ